MQSAIPTRTGSSWARGVQGDQVPQLELSPLAVAVRSLRVRVLSSDPQSSRRLVQIPLQWPSDDSARMGRRDTKDLAIDLITTNQGRHPHPSPRPTRANGRQARKLNHWINTLPTSPASTPKPIVRPLAGIHLVGEFRLRCCRRRSAASPLALGPAARLVTPRAAPQGRRPRRRPTWLVGWTRLPF
jgi:hypothetical protein